MRHRSKRGIVALLFALVGMAALALAAGPNAQAHKDQPDIDPTTFSVAVNCVRIKSGRAPQTKCTFLVNGPKGKQNVESFTLRGRPCDTIVAVSDRVSILANEVRFDGRTGWLKLAGQVSIAGTGDYKITFKHGADFDIPGPGLSCRPEEDEDRPPSTNDDAFVTDEDMPLTIGAPGVLANDTDPDGDALTAQLVAGPTFGTLILNSDGSFVYTPNADFFGDDAFRYAASDGEAIGNTATVAIAVTPVNDPPFANDDEIATDEDTPLTLVAPGVLANDGDSEGDALTAELVDRPSHGTVVLAGDGSLTYAPDPDFAGLDRFTYRAADGEDRSEPAAVGVTVNPVNDPPAATDDQFTTDEDAPLAVDAPGVLGNDTDVDGDALTATLAQPPAHGTVVLNSSGSFVYAPASDFHGEDAFTYTARDPDGLAGTAMVHITVAAVNDPPIAVDDTAATDEDTTLVLSPASLLANDTDVDGDALAISAVGPAGHGTTTLNGDGSVTYTPASNFNGTDGFTYTASDGAATSAPATVTITVRPVTDPPVAIADSYATDEDVDLVVSAPGLLANDVDVDGDALRAVRISSPSRGSLSLLSDGSFRYIPFSDINGSDSFSYAVSDGTFTSPATTVSITIRPVADPPRTANDKTTTPANTPKSINVLINDFDPDGDVIHISAVTQGAHGTVTIAADARSLTYSPNSGFAGVDTFTYTVADATGLTATAAVAVTVGSATPATLTINTVDQASGAPVFNACFALYTDLGGGTRGVSLASACDAVVTGGVLTNDGVITFANVSPGAYVLVNSLGPLGYPPAPDQAFAIEAGADLTVTVQFSKTVVQATSLSTLALNLAAVRSEIVGGAGELGESPEVAPHVVRPFVARFRFGVAVDPGGPPAEALGRANVVLEPEGDVE
jgi:hypothetical protein